MKIGWRQTTTPAINLLRSRRLDQKRHAASLLPRGNRAPRRSDPLKRFQPWTALCVWNRLAGLCELTPVFRKSPANPHEAEATGRTTIARRSTAACHGDGGSSSSSDDPLADVERLYAMAAFEEALAALGRQGRSMNQVDDTVPCVSGTRPHAGCRGGCRAPGDAASVVIYDPTAALRNS